ncbi:AtuA-related protein, partial [Nonomuraea lactucae]|uniref:AtuA-related protein n=1 Tax=Nonomuraea lactucae TaxID=2249762 RepID=UPI003B83A0E6
FLDGVRLPYEPPEAADAVRPPAPTPAPDPDPPPDLDPAAGEPDQAARREVHPAVRVPLGRVAGARSGDKGGNANLGVWVATPDQYAWLAGALTTDRLKELLPGLAAHRVDRYEFPNLNALNFVVHGLLGRGVAASPRMDPQAKALGEELRAQPVDVPAHLLP